MLFRTGQAMLTPEELEIWQQFTLLESFNIRPWEYSEDHEAYKEDLVNMMALKRIKLEAERYLRERAEWQAEVQGRMIRR